MEDILAYNSKMQLITDEIRHKYLQNQENMIKQCLLENNILLCDLSDYRILRLNHSYDPNIFEFWQLTTADMKPLMQVITYVESNENSFTLRTEVEKFERK